MAASNSIRRAAGVALLLAAVAGCGDKPLLRDHYLGKSFLEPDKVPQSVERDAYGRPILPAAGEDRPEPGD